MELVRCGLSRETVQVFLDRATSPTPQAALMCLVFFRVVLWFEVRSGHFSWGCEPLRARLRLTLLALCLFVYFQDDKDCVFEDQVLKDPHQVKSWWHYLDFKKTAPPQVPSV